MKKTIVLQILIFISFFGFSQKNIKFVFYDNCKKQVVNNVVFNLINLDNDYNNSLSKNADTDKKRKKKNTVYNVYPGKYLLKYYISEKNYTSSFQKNILIDTSVSKIKIYIPKIRVKISKKHEDLNSFDKYKNFFYCDKLCNGKLTDYYHNGKKHIEGTFKNGKAIEYTEYSEDDLSKTKHKFTEDGQNPTKTEYYNKNGELEKYVVYKYKKREIIVKTFDKDNKLIDNKISKRY